MLDADSCGIVQASVRQSQGRWLSAPALSRASPSSSSSSQTCPDRALTTPPQSCKPSFPTAAELSSSDHKEELVCMALFHFRQKNKESSLLTSVLVERSPPTQKQSYTTKGCCGFAFLSYGLEKSPSCISSALV